MLQNFAAFLNVCPHCLQVVLQRVIFLPQVGQNLEFEDKGPLHSEQNRPDFANSFACSL